MGWEKKTKESDAKFIQGGINILLSRAFTGDQPVTCIEHLGQAKDAMTRYFEADDMSVDETLAILEEAKQHLLIAQSHWNFGDT